MCFFSKKRHQTLPFSSLCSSLLRGRHHLLHFFIFLNCFLLLHRHHLFLVNFCSSDRHHQSLVSFFFGHQQRRGRCSGKGSSQGARRRWFSGHVWSLNPVVFSSLILGKHKPQGNFIITPWIQPQFLVFPICVLDIFVNFSSN